MPFESQSVLQYLVLTNFLLYAALLAGYLRFRRLASSMPHNLRQAFNLLESSIWRTHPDFPEGLTLREALGKVRNLVIEVNWQEMDRLLTQYESSRFGKSVAATPRLDEALKLNYALRRGGKLPNRP